MNIERTPHIRTSERTTEQRCPRKWWWAYREGLKPKGRVADHFWWGTIMHIAFANWYCGPGVARGIHPAETFDRLAADSLRSFKVDGITEEQEEFYVSGRGMGVVLMEEYVKRYGRDERWLVIAPEKTFEFEIPFPDWWDVAERGRKALAIYNGTADGVYRDAQTGMIWLMEHKSAKSIRVDHLPMDEQAGSYWALIVPSLVKAGVLSPKDQLQGIMYNFVRKGLPDARPVDAEGYALNKDGGRSKVQPAALFKRHEVRRTRAERKTQLLKIQTQAVRMEMMRRGDLEVDYTPHHSCARFCEFFDMCLLRNQGGAWQDIKKVAFRQEDPYADHRKSTDETGSFEFG